MIYLTLKDIVNQNGALRPWAGCYECNKFLDFLKLFEAIDMDAANSAQICPKLPKFAKICQKMKL
jgi:hypothetical protein